MAFTLVRLATQVPLPQVVENYIDQSDYNVTSSVPVLNGAQTVNAGNKQWGGKFNQNAALLEIISRNGAGVIGIADGLVITAGSGLTLNISAGQAVIEGQIEFAAGTLALGDNTTSYIWAKSDGTFEAKTTTTPPTEKSTFIGTAITSGGSITSVDNSGVVYIRSGIPYRKTADAYQPLDTPPSTWLGLTETTGGLYIWTGTEYTCIDNKTKPQIKTSNYIVVTGDVGKLFTNEGATATVTFSLPSGGYGPFEFAIHETQTLAIVASAGDTIRLGASASTTPGTLFASAIGNVVRLGKLNAAEWFVLSNQGTWTVT